MNFIVLILLILIALHLLVLLVYRLSPVRNITNSISQKEAAKHIDWLLNMKKLNNVNRTSNIGLYSSHTKTSKSSSIDNDPSMYLTLYCDDGYDSGNSNSSSSEMD